MKKNSLLFLFLIGGIIGWLIDTAYRTLTDGSFQDGGFLSRVFGFVIPFLPVYAIGLVLVYLLRKTKFGFFARFLLFAILFSSIELIGGIIVKLTIGQPLWHYPNGFLGMIDFLHATYWGTLGLTTHEIIRNG